MKQSKIPTQNRSSRRHSLWQALTVICLLVASTQPVAAQTYEKLWTRARNFAQQGLPKSAYAEVERIRKKAVAEQNTGQETAALLSGFVMRQEVAPDSFFTDILQLERRKAAADGTLALRAVYASVLGQMYASNSGRSQHGDEGVGAHPDSLREWSRQQYDSAAVANYLLSVDNMEALAAARAKDYVPLVDLGDDATYFNGDLLNVIGRRAVEGLNRSADRYDPEMPAQAPRVIHRLLRYYRAAGNEDAELLLTLDSIALTDGNRPMPLRYEQTLSPREADSLSTAHRAYVELTRRFALRPLVSEVYLTMVERLSLSPAYSVVLLEEALQRFPSYKRANALRNKLKELRRPSVSCGVAPVVRPDEPLRISLDLRNVTNMQFTLYKVLDSFNEEQMQRSRNRLSYLQKHAAQSGTWNFKPAARPDYETGNDTTAYKPLAPGHYLVRVQATAGPGYKETVRETWLYTNVSALLLMTQQLPDNRIACTVVRARDGHPVTGAKVQAYAANDDSKTALRTLTTDSLGQCFLPAREGGLRLKASLGEDKHLPEVYIGRYWPVHKQGNDEPRTVTRTAFFTDRGIYRPGQTVNIGGIRYTESNNIRQVAANSEVKVGLYDANGKVLEEQTLTTDDLGNFSARFVLPARCLPGTYSFRTDGVYHSLRVEEYKRPTFRVEFDELPARYAMGDTLTVTGRAVTFAEAPCRGARITGHYNIVHPLFRIRPYGEKPTTLDTLYTNDKGRFCLKVFLPKSDRNPNAGYGINVYAEALSAAGETQTGNLWIPVGRQALTLTAQWQDIQDKLAPDQLTFSLLSPNHKPVDGQVRYRLFPVKGKSVGSEPVFTAETAANAPTDVKGLSALPSGRYLLRASLTNSTDSAACEQLVVLYSLDDKRPPVDTLAWFQCPVDTFGTAAPARIRVGSSRKDVHLYYQVFSGRRMLDNRIITFSDSIIDLTYDYRSEYGDGISVSVGFVKDGALSQWQRRIFLPAPDTQLRLSWSTFRDKLKPGQEEEWRLKVLAPDGKPARASLMAALYDASLDQLASSTWNIYLPYTHNIPSVWWNLDRRWNDNRNYIHFQFTSKPARALQFDRFDEALLQELAFRNYGGKHVYYAMSGMGSARKSRANALATVEEVMIAEDCAAVVENTSEAPLMRATAKQAASAAPQAPAEEAAAEEETTLDGGIPTGALRTNFNETAFFYPALRTDADGEVSIAFTLPESLTAWNFQGLAHTGDMMTGLLRATAVAQKDFMVQLHRPRFVRTGDKATLTATLNNLTDKVLKGKVRFDVFNPETEKVIASSKQSFKVNAKGETTVSFSFDTPDGHDLLACRVVAQSGDFSDGEQYYLPVLTDKEWITESADVLVNGAGTHEIDLSHLFAGNDPAAMHRTLTVEYTSHPVWYAVQALPALDRPEHDDVLSLASAYYAARLATFIAQSTPRLQQVIGQWKAAEGNAETLWSRLQQDEELKAIVLAETPWVMQAEDERARKQALTTLFDVNAQAARCAELLDKLNTYQNANGSISWFPGMSWGNEYITVGVVRLFARLDKLTANASQAHKPLLDKAMNFLKKENARRVTDMRAAEKKGTRIAFPGENALHYMYSVLMDGTRLTTAQQRDMDYLLDHLAKAVGEIDNRQRALSASVLHLAGRTDKARAFAASLVEHLTQTPDRGAFFDYPGGSFTTSDTKLDTHIAAMEALTLVRPDDTALLEGMRRWLLQQKRVQMWQSPAGSANAIYVLLHGHTTDLDETGTDKLQLTFAAKGGKRTTQMTVKPDEGKHIEAGLGYMKQTYPGVAEWGAPTKLTVEKTSAGDAWGAVYAGYLMPADKVKTASTGLRVRREVNTTAPTVGGKLVTRYVITADRDYEYVMLKAPHAACCEPMDKLSGVRHTNGLTAYVAVHDASTEYFFERLPKGTYVIEATAYTDRAGAYGTGIATLQCLYAPEFTAHTGTQQLTVKP